MKKITDIKCCSCGNNDLKSNQNFIKFSEENPDLYLCEKCVTSMNYVISAENNSQYDSKGELNQPHESVNLDSQPLPSPNDIFNHLNTHVIGQEDAKKKLSIAIAHHYRRLQDKTIKKSNLLIVGPTGTGKTEMARSISSYLKIPFVSCDATNLTTRGYVGEDVESILGRLLQSVNWDVKKAENGIIFLDEVDKLARSQNGESGVNTVAVQQELLKIMEGSVVKVKKKTLIDTEEIFVDTSNILFICAGAFQGLRELVSQKENVIGIHQDIKVKIIDTNWEKSIESSHLVKYGLIPEFLGRLPLVTFTKELNVNDLVEILTIPENSIVKQYTKLFKLDNVTVSFDSAFLKKIAEESISKKLGARGLKQILENKLEPFFFDVTKYKDQTLVFNEKNLEVKNNDEEKLIKITA